MQVTGNKTISRNIADPYRTSIAWGQFVQFTAYKAANAGRRVALVNPRSTTQMCSALQNRHERDLHRETSCGCWWQVTFVTSYSSLNLQKRVFRRSDSL